MRLSRGEVFASPFTAEDVLLAPVAAEEPYVLSRSDKLERLRVAAAYSSENELRRLVAVVVSRARPAVVTRQ